jgi:5-methylcytosine-specific restriction enzyme subunit McrC
MTKVFNVIEFDTISSKPGHGCKVLDQDTFKQFSEFVKEYEASKNNGVDALEFFKLGYRRDVGEIISVKNYVGLIQNKSGIQIEILPKILFDSPDSGSYKKTKNVFLKMIRNLKEFPSKIFDSADLKVDRMNLYEIFINMYLGEVINLIRRGLRFGYETIENNINYYKGKLNVTEQIKRNATHKERFAVIYSEFTSNRPENRIIKATLEKLLLLTTSQWNAKETRQLLDHFDNVEISNIDADISLINLDRSMVRYKNIIKWSLIFLRNKSFTTFTGSNNSRSILFPMDRVFESYVANEFKKAFGSENWSISTQDAKYHLFDTPKRFSLRPDIVVDCGFGKKIILDTKWKSLNSSVRMNYGISQSDMYQMYAYAKKYKTSDVWLLYPLNQEMKNHPPITFKANEETSVNINLFFVDLANMNKSMDLLKMEIKQNGYCNLFT